MAQQSHNIPPEITSLEGDFALPHGAQFEAQLEEAMKGHILAQTELVGMYESRGAVQQFILGEQIKWH